MFVGLRLIVSEKFSDVWNAIKRGDLEEVIPAWFITTVPLLFIIFLIAAWDDTSTPILVKIFLVTFAGFLFSAAFGLVIMLVAWIGGKVMAFFEEVHSAGVQARRRHERQQKEWTEARAAQPARKSPSVVIKAQDITTMPQKDYNALINDILHSAPGDGETK
jgi:hypothetical protein